MFQCIALRLARLSILQMRKRTRPLAKSWIRNQSNFRVGLQNHRFRSKIQPASIRSLKVSHTLNNIPQRTWTETFQTYHSCRLLSIVWKRIIDGFSIDIAQCTGESTFFKDNYEHFNATGTAKLSTYDFNEITQNGICKCNTGLCFKNWSIPSTALQIPSMQQRFKHVSNNFKRFRHKRPWNAG